MKIIGESLEKYLEYKAEGKHEKWFKDLSDNYKYQLKHRVKEKKKEVINLFLLLHKADFTKGEYTSIDLWTIHKIITGESTRESKEDTLKTILQNL